MLQCSSALWLLLRCFPGSVLACCISATAALADPAHTTGGFSNALQGLSSFAPEFGGNVTGLVEDSVLVFGNDPTVPDGTRATGVVMVSLSLSNEKLH